MAGRGVSGAYRGLFALIGWGVLGLQYWLMIAAQPSAEVPRLTLNFFSYFTILTNVLVALAMTLPVAAANSPVGRWAASGSVRACVTMYAVVVGLVYHFLLHATWNPQGLALIVNIGLDYVMPLAMLADWLVLTPKGGLRRTDPFKWLAFPLVYGGWTVAHGLTTDWWPYWFVDVSELGWGKAVACFAGLLVFFLTVGLLVVAFDDALGRGDRRPARH